MAIIKCPECGKEFSDKAVACPNCGCPIDAVLNSLAESSPSGGGEYPEETSVSEKMMGLVQNGVSAVIEANKNAIRPTKNIGPIQIDENHQKFRINGSVPMNGKKSGIGKTMFKGVMAMSTMGLSVAAEKLVGGNKQHVGNKEWLDYSDLLNYELLEDDSIVTSGGVGQVLIGGALFGGFGAVSGGITANRTQKKKIESLYVKATVNNFSSPCIMIPLITKPTKTNSKEYETAFNLAHQILSALDVITHNK